MGGNIQPKDVSITYIDRNPTFGAKIKNVIMSAFGYGNKLSRIAHIGREASPAHPIHGAHIVIKEPVAVVEYETQRFSAANDPAALEDRRTRRLPAVKPNNVSFNASDRIKLANDPKAIEERRTRRRTN